MSPFLPKMLVLVAAAVFIGLAVRTILQRIAGRPDRDEWLKHLAWPAVALILALAVNGTAFMQESTVAGIMEAQEEYMRPDGSIEPNEYGRFDLLLDQFSVVIGTGLLMFVISRAVRKDEIYALPRPRTAGLYAQRIMIERLLTRHWLAVIGFGTVFGVASGPGIVLLLALELTFISGCCVIGMKYFDRPAETERSKAAQPGTPADENPYAGGIESVTDRRDRAA